MSAPTWLAAAAGQPGLAGQVNQFLAAHGSSWIFQGTVRVSQTAGSGLYQPTASTYLAQQFTTAIGQTAIGQVGLQVSTIGGSPVSATITPLTVSLYADGGGMPTGGALAAVSMTETQVYPAPFWVTLPLPASGLTAGAPYWLVVSPAGTTSAYYAWQQSSQIAGAATSPDGSSWSPQSYGLMFKVYDVSAVGRLQAIYEDGGARVTTFSYNAAGQLTSLTEYTAGQNGTSLSVTRALTYTSGALTGVN